MVFLNLDVIDTPQNPKLEFEGNIAKMSWDEVDDVSYYIVKFISYNRDEIVSQKEFNKIYDNQFQVTITSAGRYGFNVISYNAESGIASLPTLTIIEDYYLSLDRISEIELKEYEENKLIVSWNRIRNAVGYDIYLTTHSGLNEVYSTTQTHFVFECTQNSYDKYYVYVVAKADIDSKWKDSAPSKTVNYTQGVPDSDARYYYKGEYNSLTILTQEEFNNYISWAILHKQTDFTLDIFIDVKQPLLNSYYLDYCDFITSKTTLNYVQDDETILNEFLTALYSYNNDVGGVKLFEVPVQDEENESRYTFHFEYYSDGFPQGTSQQTYVASCKDFKPLNASELGLTKRGNFYNNFKINNLTQVEEVSTSDQLLDAIIYLKAKPQFIIADSSAERIYKAAKDILVEIISDDMTDFQKVCAIFDYLVFNVKLDTKCSSLGDEDFNCCMSNYLEGVFINKIATNIGLSKAFSLMCAIEGINSRYIMGYRLDKDENELYAVNKVKILDSWYVIDIGANVILNPNGDIPTHYNYFLVSDSVIKSKFKAFITSDIDNPSAVSTLDYYSSTIIGGSSLDIQSTTQLQNIIDYYKSNNKLGFECSIPKALEDEAKTILQNNSASIKYTSGTHYLIIFN